MLPYTLFFLIHSIFANAIEDSNITLGFTVTKAVCPLDPFHNLRIHATPKLSDPICCLRPPSEDLTQTDEFLSFEEWKSRQRDLEAHSLNTHYPNQTNHVNFTNSETTNGTSVVVLTSSLGDNETILDLTPTQLPHYRVPLTDRFNYASLDCSARIRSSHPSARSPPSILSSKKDRYMLSPCSALPNYVVVELCDDIRIDTVQLANFEYFSGVFRDFKVSVAQTYTKDEQAWVEAGTYRAKNIRGVQSFHPLVELQPFFRYIRIDILSHYGNEYYCPISLLRVYGLTQLEEWKWELWQSASEPTSNLPNPIIIQPTESDSVPNTNGLTSSFEDSSEEPSAGIKEILFSIPNSQPMTDPNVAIHNQSVSTLLSDSSTPSSVSVMSSVEPVTNPTNPPDAAISHSSSATPMTSSNTSYPSGESIFRTIMNRLNMLEANTTLYHKYVEEQTLRLRDALRKLEEDVGRLEGLNKNQQQIFFKTIQELNRHHRQMETERSVLRDRVDRLADEVILEKRLGIAQLCLLLTVLIFMTLTRGSRTNISTLFGGPTHKTSRYTRTRWSSSLDVSDNFGRPRSQTPVPGAPWKKAHRVRSQSISTASTPIAAPRSPRDESPTKIAQSPDSAGNNIPTYRLHRSSSNTTPVYTLSSAKRLAQTAHLHEISMLKRHRSDQTSLGPSNNVTLRRRKIIDAIDDIYTPNNRTDRTSDSWIDTEPGSGPSDDEPETSLETSPFSGTIPIST